MIVVANVLLLSLCLASVVAWVAVVVTFGH